MTDLQIASPRQIAIAWSSGALYMRSDDAAKWVDAEFKAHPVPSHVDDPTYHREEYQGGDPRNGGWNRAKDCQNPVAMTEVREFLLKQGLALPTHVSMAWAESLERLQWRADVNRVVAESIAGAFPMAKGVRDILDALIADLEAMRFHLGDLPVEPTELPEEVDLSGID